MYQEIMDKIIYGSTYIIALLLLVILLILLIYTLFSLLNMLIEKINFKNEKIREILVLDSSKDKNTLKKFKISKIEIILIRLKIEEKKSEILFLKPEIEKKLKDKNIIELDEIYNKLKEKELYEIVNN